MALDPMMIDALAPVGVSAVLFGTIGWVVTTWLRVKNGYPLESSWGRPMLPMSSRENDERVKMLAQENAQLHAELGGVKDRLAVLERIAVDKGSRLAAEIDALERKALN